VSEGTHLMGVQHAMVSFHQDEPTPSCLERSSLGRQRTRRCAAAEFFVISGLVLFLRTAGGNALH